jgi:integrase
MGRPRKHDRHLPPRVYERREKLYYVHPETEEWIPLEEGLVSWARLVGSSENADTMTVLWAKYQVDVLCKLKPKTQRNRKQEWKQLQRHFGTAHPASIEPHHVWKYWRERTAPEQAKHEVRCLSALLTYARQIGAIKHANPCFGLRMKGSKPRVRYITDEEFLAVRDLALKAYSANQGKMMAYAMDLSYITAMSQIDILKLERRQLTPDGIYFEREKTNASQLIEWNDDLRAIIEDLKRIPPQLRPTLICTTKSKKNKPAGTAYTSQGFEANWQRLLRKAITTGALKERFTFHDIRAKSLSDAKSLEEAQKRGGHSDSKITKTVYRRLPTRATAQKLVVAQS